MYLHDPHYEWIQRVTQCDSKSQVQDILKEYNDKDFTDWIHSLLETARKVVIKMKKMNGEDEELYSYNLTALTDYDPNQ